MLQVANLANTKRCKNPRKLLKARHVGTHLRVPVLSETNPMNTNMIGIRWFSRISGVLVLWMRVASALEGLRIITMLCFMSKVELSIRVKGNLQAVS